MPTFDRRAVLAGAVSSGLASAIAPRAALAASPVPPTNNLHFDIFRNGKPFGKYQVVFTTSGDMLTATTDVHMNMQIAKLTVFDYVHHCEEIWRGGRFMEMRSHSVRDRNNAQADTVTAVRGDFGIHITTNKDQLSAPVKANPLTHWNQATLSGPLFNPQDGLILDLASHPLGRDGVTLANGSKLLANHVALRGWQQMDEWYDDTGVWAGLSAVFPDKSLVEYRRV